MSAKRRWLPAVGLSAMACVVATIGWFAIHTEPMSPKSAAQSPTPDPQKAYFKNLSIQFMNAVDESEKTGDASKADAFTVAGSEANGNAGLGALITHQNKQALVVDRLDVDPDSWNIQVGTETDVNFTYHVFAHPASFPQLNSEGADQERGPFTAHLAYEKVNGQWLIFTFDD